MIRVGILTTPLTSGHSFRGVGFYTQLLLSSLKKHTLKSDFEIVEVSSLNHLSNLQILHYPHLDLFQPTLKIFPAIKTIVTIHDVIPLEYPAQYPPGLRGYVNFLSQKNTLTQVGQVITDSFASIKSIKKYLGTPDHKIKLVYLAAADHFKPIKNPNALKETAKKFKLPNKFILYVGDLNWNKNLITLLKSCIDLGQDIVLVGKSLADPESAFNSTPSGPMDRIRSILGQDHPQMTHIGQIRDLLASPLVHALGFISDADLVSVYNLATIYCQPSFAEGFGLPVLEAMSCGTPVIVSNTHSLPEVAGPAGIYFDPLKKDSLTECINLSINNIQLLKSKAKAGIIQAKKFSPDLTAKNTLLVYDEALRSSQT